MIQAVVFDLDNTLIDFLRMKQMSVAAAIRAMQRAGLKIPYQKSEQIMFELYSKYGMEYQEIFQEFLKVTLGRLDYKLLATAIVSYREAERLMTRPYPKVKSTLKELKKHGIKLSILSDAPRMRAWLRLAEMGITDYFEPVLCIEDTKARKPDSRPFRCIIKHLDTEPGNILMVGDSLPRDIYGAKKAGMRTCYTKYGEMNIESCDITPDYSIESIDELIRIIKK